MAPPKSPQGPQNPTIENRQARFDYHIGDTLEVGISLTGSEVKSLRAGRATLAAGFVMARALPPRLTLHEVHIDEYPQALPQHQHAPKRVRALLAHRREIEKLATQVQAKGVALVPLKIYFHKGRAKLLIGVGTGRKKWDKREAIRARDDKKSMGRATLHKR